MGLNSLSGKAEKNQRDRQRVVDKKFEGQQGSWYYTCIQNIVSGRVHENDDNY